MKSLTFLILALLLLLAFPLARRRSPQQDGGDVDYYTCTMHPSVHSKDPGKMPDLFDGLGAGEKDASAARRTHALVG